MWACSLFLSFEQIWIPYTLDALCQVWRCWLNGFKEEINVKGLQKDTEYLDKQMDREMETGDQES